MKPVSLVTGAAGGIGAALVRELVTAGFAVVATDALLAESPEGSRFVAVDLAHVDAAAHLVSGIAAAEGRLDLIVNNAALQVSKVASATTIEEWDRVMAINVRAPFLLACEGRELLRRQRGAIVNIASVHAAATSPGLAAYAASKGALVALTRSLALELAPDGIRVNAVLPGAIDTPMLDAGLARESAGAGSLGERKARLALLTPAGRLGRPEDVAQAVLFLADGARSGFITGQTLVADGGALARLSTE